MYGREIKEEFAVYSLDGLCVIKGAMVECQLIPSINTLDQPLIKTQSTQHLNTVNTSVKLLTLHWHLRRQSTNVWSFHRSQLTLTDVFQLTVHQVSTEYQSGCAVSIDQDVDFRVLVERIDWLWMPLVLKKICLV